MNNKLPRKIPICGTNKNLRQGPVLDPRKVFRAQRVHLRREGQLLAESSDSLLWVVFGCFALLFRDSDLAVLFSLCTFSCRMRKGALSYGIPELAAGLHLAFGLAQSLCFFLPLCIPASECESRFRVPPVPTRSVGSFRCTSPTWPTRTRFAFRGSRA